MTAKPLLSPAGSPGNLQDIGDALKALANLQACHDASVEQVSRLEANLTEARAKIEELEAAVTDAESEANDARGEAEDAEERAREAEREADAMSESLDYTLAALVNVREALFSGGDTRKAREDLDIILNRMAPSWRCGGCNVGQVELY